MSLGEATEKARYRSETVSELAGFFSPGGVPTVSSVRTLSPQMTHAHECGHQELCQTTSLGWYLTVLSRTIPRLPDGETRSDALRAEFESFVDATWVTQEGYATLRQVAFCFRHGATDDIGRFLDMLPQSYSGALEIFLGIGSDEEVHKLAHRIYSGRYAGDELDEMVGLSMQMSAYVAAKVAMSPPLSGLLRTAQTLPCPRIAEAMILSAPDSRLERAIGAIDAGFFELITTRVLGAMEASVATGSAKGAVTPRLMDDAFDALCCELAEKASLEFEPSHAIGMAAAVLRILQIDYCETDERDLMLSQHRPSGTVRISSSHTSLDLPPEALKQIGLHIKQFELLAAGFARPPFPAEVPSVPAMVCEVLPGDRGQAVICVRAYADHEMFERVRRIIDPSTSPVIPDPFAPFPVVRGLTFPLSLKDIRALVRATRGTWCWLLLEGYLDVFLEQSEDELAIEGQIFVVGDYFEYSAWRTHPVSVGSHAGFMNSVKMPDGLHLALQKIYKGSHEVHRVSLCVQPGIDGVSGDFLHSCVADALYHSGLSKFLMERG